MAGRRGVAYFEIAMKTSSLGKGGPQATKNEGDASPCTEPGHCPPETPTQSHQAISPRWQRRIPPEAELRAFEDAVNGWWWL
jgi:hypothetical protein